MGDKVVAASAHRASRARGAAIKRGAGWHTMALVVVGIVAAVAAKASAEPMIALPPPSQQPQAIDFAQDPLLAWVGASTPADAFRQQLADAVARHPTVGEANAGVEEAEAARREARAGLFPTVGAQVVASRRLASNYQTLATVVESLSPHSRSDLVGSADQLLFDWGATSNRIAAGSAQVKAASAETGRVATDTALRAITAWYNVLMFQSLVQLQDAAIARYRQIAGDTREREKAGLGAGGDVARAEAGMSAAIAYQSHYARQLEQSRAQFRELFGIDAPARLARPAVPTSGAADMDSARALSHRTPGAAEAAARAEAARRQARAVAADRLPRLSAGVTGTQYDVLDKATDYEVRAQVVLRQSFGFGGAEAARTDEARARARAAEFVEERIVGEAERDAGGAYADAALTDRALAALSDAYRANRRARDVTAEQYRLSRGSLLDVLRVEEEYLGAAANLLQGAVERDLARYTLMARTGELLPLIGLRNDGAAR